MEGLQWYPRYAGDYIRKTRHLSLLEHGAYNLLLDHYYATGKPIKVSNASLMPDHSRVYRLCSAVTNDEKQAVDSVLEMFFELTDEGYINSKAATVLEKQRAAHERRVNAGRKGGKQSLSNAKAKPKQPEPEPEPIYNIYIGENVYTPDMYFEVFWNNYPSSRPKGNKNKAREIFKKIMKGTKDYEQFDRATKDYRKFCEAGNYNQHATTWLNQRGWETDWAEQAEQCSAKSGKSGAAKAAIMRGLE